MSQLSLDSPVGQWVAERPYTSRVFEAIHIDYCCGGDKPLSAACEARNIDPQQVLARLEDASSDPTAQGKAERWIDASLTELCDHIEQTHHAYLKTELPRLQKMIAKVVGAHGASHPEMANAQQAFAALHAELAPHMTKEEQILFPAIRRLEECDTPPAFPFGTVANPIRMMEHEHDNAGNALDQIRRATGDYRVPDDACNTYRAMLDGLQRLELDMHQHVHKENIILFPRAIALEQSRIAV
jgi:regulator of cell morphogenesis and NO signaling